MAVQVLLPADTDFRKKDGGRCAGRTSGAGYAVNAGGTSRVTLGDFSNRGYDNHTSWWRVVNIFGKQLLREYNNRDARSQRDA